MTKHIQNSYLDFLISTRYLGVNRFFVVSFENEVGRIGQNGYYLPAAEIKGCYITIDRRNVLINLLKMI